MQIPGQEQPGGDADALGILQAGHGIHYRIDAVVEIYPLGDGAIGGVFNPEVDQVVKLAVAEKIEAGNRELCLQQIHQGLQWIEEIVVQELGDLGERPAGRCQFFTEIEIDVARAENKGRKGELETGGGELAIAPKQHLAVDADHIAQRGGDLGIDLEAGLGAQINRELAEISQRHQAQGGVGAPVAAVKQQ